MTGQAVIGLDGLIVKMVTSLVSKDASLFCLWRLLYYLFCILSQNNIGFSYKTEHDVNTIHLSMSPLSMARAEKERYSGMLIDPRLQGKDLFLHRDCH